MKSLRRGGGGGVHMLSSDNLGCHIDRHHNTNLVTDLLLNSNSNLSTYDNTLLFNMVQTYITNTKRF